VIKMISDRIGVRKYLRGSVIRHLGSDVVDFEQVWSEKQGLLV
jgi:hypothetical protein